MLNVTTDGITSAASIVVSMDLPPVHLIADGSTTTIESEFPSLSYNLVTISGAENPLAAPIYMVKLDTDNAVYAGLNDVEITLDEIPGFKLEVAAGSVTFPDGSKEGLLSVTVVNASKVPMAPPNGMQPQLIVTIQPVGAVFDPPAPLSLPNVDGHLPGAQVEMYSFDHDLEEFVAIGLGTISEDGSIIKSNNGVGVIKAGWHCGSQPDGDGCTHQCADFCKVCNAQCNCVADSGKKGEAIPGKDGYICSLDGSGKHEKEEEEEEDGIPGKPRIDAEPSTVFTTLTGTYFLDETVVWQGHADNGTCKNGVSYRWVVEGSISGGQSLSRKFANEGDKAVKLTAYCSGTPINETGQVTSTTVTIITFQSVKITTPTNTIWNIDANVTMPSVTFEVKVLPISIPIDKIEFSWRLETDFNHTCQTASKPCTNYALHTETETVSGLDSSWDVSFSEVYGGNEITVFVTASIGSITTPEASETGYEIRGDNPDKSQVLLRAGSDPWFLPRLISKESTFRQFNVAPNGMPNWGEPNGWGLMQRDPPLSEKALWNWMENIKEGKSILILKRAEAQDFWDAQVMEYELYNLQNGTNIMPYNDGYLVISDVTFSYLPTGTERPFSDGLWIKHYNGSSRGYWMSWKNNGLTPNEEPYWKLNDTNSNDLNYVKDVLKERP